MGRRLLTPLVIIIMRYFKCRTTTLSPLVYGNIYGVSEDKIERERIGNFWFFNFIEVDNITKLLIIGGKIKTEALP
jgi:hypothetical protein